MTFKPTRRSVLQGMLAGSAAFAVMGAFPAFAQQKGGKLTVGLTYEIDTMNVYSTGFLGDAQAAVVEGLLAPDEHAKYVPVLATEVPTLENGGIVVSEDGKTMKITYKLRPGVKWHDGAPFTSADVKYTWEAVKDPAFIAESKDGSSEVESIDTPDDLTVVVNYNTILPTFASTLFTFGIMPKHLLEGTDLNTSSYNETPVGTGPFKVTEFVRGQYVVTERFEDYWRKADNGDQLPYLDGIIFKMIPDTNTLITQLKSGEVQLVVQTPYNQAAQVEGIDGIELVKGPLLSWQHLDFNFKRPSLADINVRKAIASAIDRSILIKAQGGFPEAIKSPVVPVFDFYDPNTPETAYDVEAAKKLLDDAGYKPGGDGIREKDGERLSYTFMVQAGRADDELAQQVIIAQLKAIGIEATADNKTGVAYREARYKGGYDLIYGRWITSADPVYSVFWGTGGANNGQSYSNPALDAAFGKFENTLDPAVRKEAAAEFQKILAEDLPTISLTTNVALIAKTEKLKNFVPNPTNMTNFVNSSPWYLE
ncbi:peptide ABC transporter substrate-binding protein [Youhaiella tibetensis]|uniref:Peptide ABC transporter substrate-binding protein n=1 Tax=Paradevosia tibetensis TaxID=1447062 RepID=A0A5B9DKK2_9HYPH|nr:peptide ABC transporter substrate-binding protein [Youhaiella tibetensis]QEE19770.1 peptide ABC transporter substrate-binding protein [Youhaiella tibetensis]GGF30121.1 peptide ABC transporter substrate-binding protein [Youhaiella tibetensis]